MLRVREAPKLPASAILNLCLGLSTSRFLFANSGWLLNRVATELEAETIFAPTKWDRKQISTLLSGEFTSLSYPPIALNKSALISITDSGVAEISFSSC